ncbi:MAG: hypothetical protein B5766_09465 [Candidatus Lumbricidophila eiseniae]|uniref:Uncharacterized protein n=1 Tax=Candidatus Lumbricidiphila eiseniae TaxID=1969409 RepID=A0A2A6FQ56_9MICO|nr:MAG: hypothetical protein B5766_09465 [Candidatus Lumbricidophila eiseniae]
MQKTPGLLAENTIGQNLTSNSRRQQEIINTGTSAEFIINTFKNVAVLTANERKRPCSRSGVPSASPAFDPNVGDPPLGRSCAIREPGVRPQLRAEPKRAQSSTT